MEARETSTSVDLTPFDLHAVEPVLRVRNVEETVEWYQTRLGFTVDYVWGEPVEHAGVSSVDHGIGVKIQFTAGLPEGSEPSTSGWMMIRVGNNIDELYEAYKSRGVVVARPLAARPWGMRDFDIVDCNGHILRFAAEG